MVTNTPGMQLEKLRRQVARWDRMLADDLDQMDANALERRILQSEQSLLENKRARADDQSLQAAKAVFEREDAPYKETAALQRAIIEYCLALIEEKGQEAGQL